ncbi:hypothetical protein HK405_015765, partial [Cladochytrium tenue]
PPRLHVREHISPVAASALDSVGIGASGDATVRGRDETELPVMSGASRQRQAVTTYGDGISRARH